MCIIGTPMQSERDLNSPFQISSMTLMELYYGAYKSQKMESNLAKVRKIENSLEIITVSRETAEIFGMLKTKLEATAMPLDDFDLILAATALSHNLILITNNERHFNRIDGLKIENWSKQ
ncbi:MAG: PIN domain-containing protein [Pseudomonadota bacterium]